MTYFNQGLSHDLVSSRGQGSVWCLGTACFWIFLFENNVGGH